MKIPMRKLKAIILFFCSNTDTKFLGKVKLMKLFYFLDFMHLKKYGVPITYDCYVNLEHGPIPSSIKNLVDTASDDIDNSTLADIISIEHPEGTNMCRIVASRPFTKKDEELFTNSEIEILNKVCLMFGNKNTKFIEDASHEEAPWRETRFLENIPYALAAKDKDSEFTEKEIKLSMEI